jgi:uncharacterized protein (TIGR03067 family)
MGYRLVLTIAAVGLVSAGAWSGEKDNDDLTQDRQRILGMWSVVAYDQDGKPLPAEIIQKMSVIIQADKITIKPKVVAQRIVTLKDDRRQADVKFTIEEGKVDEAPYRLDTIKKRKVIELTQGANETRKTQGAYLLEEDMLTICLPLGDRKLPKKLPAGPAAGVVRLVLKRAIAGK